jgi:C-terminal processing protease CtpA/Prc
MNSLFLTKNIIDIMNKILFKVLFVQIIIGFTSCNFSDVIIAPIKESINPTSDTILYNTEFDVYTPEQFDATGRIFYFIKIFGILKYFPIYTTYYIDKDILFYQYYNDIKYADSKESFNDVLQKMIDHYPIDLSINCVDSIAIYYFTWQRDTNYFTATITEQLTKILNMNNGYSGYIIISDNGFLTFSDRKEYRCKKFPNEETRVWGLANYWNIINHFYVHRNLIKDNWEQVLYHYIQEFQKTETKQQYVEAIMRLTAELDDSHSGISMRHAIENKIIGEYHPECFVKKQDDYFIVNQIWGNLQNSGLIKHGDIILKLNDKSLNAIYEELSPLVSSSNQHSESRAISKILLFSFQKENKIDFIRDGKEYSIDIQFNTVSSLQKSFNKQEKSQNKNRNKVIEQYKDISYINISKLNKYNFKKNIALMGDKIILDFRHGVDYRVSIRLFYYLLPPYTHFYNFTYSNSKQPGSFKVHSGYSVGSKGLLKDKRVVVLVNENTQSEAEFVVMAFQKLPNIKTIGGQTAGADGNVSQFIFPGKIGATFTSIGIRYKDNTETQQCGVRLDEELYPTLEDIQNKQDVVLQRAIEILNNDDK